MIFRHITGGKILSPQRVRDSLNPAFLFDESNNLCDIFVAHSSAHGIPEHFMRHLR